MRFDLTINLGHLLTIIIVIIGFLNQWFSVKAKLKEHDDGIERHTQWIKKHEACTDKMEDLVGKLNGAVEYMRGALGVPAK